ncbi:EF-hand domain-containing protein [Falsirhodobacter halotolerans]|uniref:EF-hand domain-containing protein n=1 Tax=Falsirhodobacter halotolerans TaxID=1146892 RepID=UPI001FD170A8|nr:EF-hand domain-containing protein [Falsirhodobacter halotolerans]MCJ8140470.1 EF-hand domain-containing protein [Falsirhodobacter halotolerans]
MNRFLAGLTFISVTAAGLSGALAAPPGPGGHGPRLPPFSELDTNGDGRITPEELTAHATARAQDRAEKMMEKLDTNGDGLLSIEELSKAPEGHADRMIERVDTDKDGAVSQEEYDAAVQRMRDRMPPRPAN